MREFMGLYRGKRIDNGEWVEGAFCPKSSRTIFGKPEDIPSIIKLNDPHSGFWFEVDPETVGECTGLRDKNGKLIFEGDIGRYKQTDGAKINGKPIICIGKVVYNEKNASFAVDSKDEIGAKNYDYFPIKDFEIIGNIQTPNS